jgi:hypothetical protein
MIRLRPGTDCARLVRQGAHIEALFGIGDDTI